MKKMTIGLQMLEGVAQYIPEMAQATIIDVRFGIVQTAGKLELSDLTDPNNLFHQRDYDGIRQEQIGLISNPCMKLFYFIRNALKVGELLDSQCSESLANQQILKEIEQMAEQASVYLPKDIKKTLRDHFDRTQIKLEQINH